MFIRPSCLLPAFIGAALAVPMAKRASPSVQLDDGTFVGTSDGVVDRFLGIPFAKPPYVLPSLGIQLSLVADRVGVRTGNLRFNLPVAVDPYNGTHEVTAYGPACPQQAITLPDPAGLPDDAVNFIVNSIYQLISPSAEDCEPVICASYRVP